MDDYDEELEFIRPWFDCSDELLEEAYNEALNFGESTNNTAELIAFINGYIIAIENYKLVE